MTATPSEILTSTTEAQLRQIFLADAAVLRARAIETDVVRNAGMSTEERRAAQRSALSSEVRS